MFQQMFQTVAIFTCSFIWKSEKCHSNGMLWFTENIIKFIIHCNWRHIRKIDIDRIITAGDLATLGAKASAGIITWIVSCSLCGIACLGRGEMHEVWNKKHICSHVDKREVYLLLIRQFRLINGNQRNVQLINELLYTDFQIITLPGTLFRSLYLKTFVKKQLEFIWQLHKNFIIFAAPGESSQAGNSGKRRKTTQNEQTRKLQWNRFRL